MIDRFDVISMNKHRIPLVHVWGGDTKRTRANKHENIDPKRGQTAYLMCRLEAEDTDDQHK
jgi:hypothetical protein